MTVVSGQNVSFDAHGRLVVWINYALEALWLLVVVLVPLAFVSQDYVLSEAKIAYLELPKIALLRTMAGLMTILWLLEWAIGPRSSGGGVSWLHPATWLAELGAWIQASSTRWVFLAVWLFLGAVTLSTVLSASFSVSMWGEVPGQDGNSAYTTLAYLLLFGVVATHLKTRPQLWRLLGAIVVMGTLVAGYAVMEHYGQGIFDLKPLLADRRVSSTLGNPILAAAVMLMTIPISLSVAAITMRGSTRRVRFWVKAGLWVLIVSVQMQAIIYTLSRGPWIGTIFSLSVLLLLLAVFVGREALARVALVLVLAGGLTWIAISTAVSPGQSRPTVTAGAAAR